jgi:hypothetical protein
MQTPRGSRRWPALLLAGAVLAGCSGLVAASTPWTAGERSSRAVAIPPADLTVARTRADAIRTRLGLPGRATTVERIEDRLEGRVFDRITFQDAAGPSALVELEPNGRPHLVVALGWRGSAGPAAGRNVALRMALAHARAAGFEVAGRPTILETADGWDIVWERQVDGIPVLGDGVRASVWADGSFHAIVQWEHALAPRPATIIDEGTARSVAAGLFAARAGSDRAIVIRSARLAYVRPNDGADPSRPDAPLAEARLAWVVLGEPADPAKVLFHRAEVWLDAGDGSVLGGDVAE